MKIGWKTLNINGNNIEALVTNYEEGDLELLGNLYIRWRDLNNDFKKISTRGINIPEIITENAFCMFFPDCFRVVKLKKGKCSFDAIDTVTGKTIQIKATSIEEDVSSFGPRSEYDELYFLDFSRANGTFDVYKIDPNLIHSHKVNKMQTFDDQQKENRRPRFSLKEIALQNNIKPIKTCSLV